MTELGSVTWQPRRTGKTATFYDETLRLWLEHFEGRSLVCHPDEYERHRAGLSAAVERAGYRGLVVLTPDDRRGQRGVLLAFRNEAGP